MRRSILMWTVLCAAVVVGLFVVKHRVQGLEEKLQSLNAEIISDQNAIQVLEAEWSYLNQPARLEELSRRLLGMTAPDPEQTLTLQEFVRGPEEPAETERGTAIADRAPAPPARKPAAAKSVRVSAPAPAPASVPASATASGQKNDEDWLAPILATLKKGSQ